MKIRLSAKRNTSICPDPIRRESFECVIRADPSALSGRRALRNDNICHSVLAGGWSRGRLLLDCCPLDFRSIFLSRAVLFQFTPLQSAFDSPAYKRDETRDSDTAPGNQLRSPRPGIHTLSSVSFFFFFLTISLCIRRVHFPSFDRRRTTEG